MKTSNALTATAIALALAVAPGGCASIFHGTHQEVSVSTDSPWATLRADGTPIAQGRVLLRRGIDHTIAAEVAGRPSVVVPVTNQVSVGYALLDGVVAI